MGGGAISMGVLGTHVPSAHLLQGTEILGVVRARLIALEAVQEDRLLRLVPKSLPKDCACVSVFALTVWWPLASEDMGDMDTRGGEYGGWQWGTSFEKMREEAGMNGGMSEVLFDSKELALCTILSVVKLHSLLFHISQLVLVSSVPVYIHNDPGIFEVDKGIVNEKSTDGGRMKNVEVSIFDPNTIEIGGWEGLSVEGGRIFSIPFVLHPYKMSILINTPIRNVLCDLSLSFLIKEDDGVKVWLSPVISYPSLTWMIRILEVAGQRGGKADGLGGGGGSGDSGLVLSEMNGFIVIDAVVAHVGISEIKDAGNKEQVLYCFEVMVGGLESFIVKPIVP